MGNCCNKSSKTKSPDDNHFHVSNQPLGPPPAPTPSPPLLPAQQQQQSSSNNEGTLIESPLDLHQQRMMMIGGSAGEQQQQQHVSNSNYTTISGGAVNTPTLIHVTNLPEEGGGLRRGVTFEDISGSAITLPGYFESRGDGAAEPELTIIQLASAPKIGSSGGDWFDNEESKRGVSIVQGESGSCLEPFDDSAPDDATGNIHLQVYFDKQQQQQHQLEDDEKDFARMEHSTLQDHNDSSSGADSTHELLRGIDADGNKLLNEYVVVAPLGQGTYGKVKLAVDTIKGTSVAIKILNKVKLEKQSRLSAQHETPIQLVHQEIAIMRACRHPNLVKLIHVIKDPNEPKLYLVMEFMEGGALSRTPPISMLPTAVSDVAPTLDIARVRANILDVLHGLQCLHNKGVIHMDIKPENILLGKDGDCKLADFGVCAVLSESFERNSQREDVVYGLQGTPPYFAPEMLVSAKTSFHGKATDMWALGVTMYVLVYGHLPFQGSSLAGYYNDVRSTREPVMSDLHGVVPITMIDVMRRMLDKNHKDRACVRDLISHPFFATSIDRVPLLWWIRHWKEEKKKKR